MNDLSYLIVAFRGKHNLTQKEFADKCNLSRQTILAIENRNQQPTKLTQAKIENILKEDN